MSDLATAVGIAIKAIKGNETTPIQLNPLDNNTPAALVIPNGHSVYDLKPLQDARRSLPERIKQKATASDADSFAKYINTFKNPDTMIFVDDAKPQALAIIDHHVSSFAAPEDGRQRWGQQTITYDFPLAESFTRWRAATKTWMDQAEFAQFMDGAILDVTSPPLNWLEAPQDMTEQVMSLLNISSDFGATEEELRDEPKGEDEEGIPRNSLYKLRRINFGSRQTMERLVNGITITAGAKAKSAYNTKTGAKAIAYEEEHDASDKNGRQVQIPDYFLIYTQIFQKGAKRLLPVKLSYRLRGGSVAWSVDLVDARRVMGDAIAAQVDEIAAATGCTTIFGRPGQ